MIAIKRALGPNALIEFAKKSYLKKEYSVAKVFLNQLWISEIASPGEFEAFACSFELQVLEDEKKAIALLEEIISSEYPWRPFWLRRSLAEQSALFEWMGLLYFRAGLLDESRDALTRSASLGRDNSILWFYLSFLYLKESDFDFAARYFRRSLELYRQPDFDLFEPSEYTLGFFSSQEHFWPELKAKEYLEIILGLSRLAGDRRSLRAIDSLLNEMQHQFPEDATVTSFREILRENRKMRFKKTARS